VSLNLFVRCFSLSTKPEARMRLVIDCYCKYVVRAAQQRQYSFCWLRVFFAAVRVAKEQIELSPSM
jgi:hypothetical protein